MHRERMVGIAAGTHELRWESELPIGRELPSGVYSWVPNVGQVLLIPCLATAVPVRENQVESRLDVPTTTQAVEVRIPP